MKECTFCGHQCQDNAITCNGCGGPFGPVQQSPPYHSQSGNVYVNQVVQQRTNGIGTAGFVLALIALFLGWIPVVGWVLWILGLIFSLIGLFRTPRGFAVAGLIISVIGLSALLFIFGAIFALISGFAFW